MVLSKRVSSENYGFSFENVRIHKSWKRVVTLIRSDDSEFGFPDYFKEISMD